MPPRRMHAQDWISLVGERLGVPKVFRDAIFGIESAGGRVDIHDSVKGAMGAGQLMPKTAKSLGVDPRNPAENIYGSLKLQKQLLDKYRNITGNEKKAWLLAAAAYNAGEPAVDRHGGIPPYKETQNYIKKLAAAMRRGGVSTTSTASQQQQRQEQPPLGMGDFRRAEAAENRRPPKEALLSPMPKAPRGNKRPPKESILTPVEKVRSTQGMGVGELRRLDEPALKEQLSKGTQQIGLTPPPRRSEYQKAASTLYLDAVSATRGGATLVLSPDSIQSFLEGVGASTAKTVADVGFAVSKLPSNVIAKEIVSATGGKARDPFQTIQKFGERYEQKAFESFASHRADTFTGRLQQSIARGAGASLVEFPKLIAGGRVLPGALNLATQMGISGARTEGPKGLVKGAVGGVVYHYGGQITGKYLGKVANTVFWVGAPAAEQNLVNGIPIEDAIGESIPLGLFQSVGQQRAYVRTAAGKVRAATPLDIPKIARGRLEVLEPQQVVMSRAADQARLRLSGFIKTELSRLATEEGGFANLRKGEQSSATGLLSRIPKQAVPELVTIGAFHYEAGTRTLNDWVGRMLGELGETPDTVKPAVMKQLGDVYMRSRSIYEKGTAPIFYSGLRQVIKELVASKLVGKTLKPEQFIKTLKQRGQAEELRASGLEEALLNWKKNHPDRQATMEDVITFLDVQGMSLEVMRGERSKRHGFTGGLEEEEGAAGVIPGVAARAAFVTEGGRNYFEGIVHSNKAMSMSADEVHMGVRPDQVSWYRGQLLGSPDIYYSVREVSQGRYFIQDPEGNIDPTQGPWYYRLQAQNAAREKNLELVNFSPNRAILEEAQSKRNQISRRYGVTEDPDNAHSRLISLYRERDVLEKEATDLEAELGISRWEPIDDYSRFTPEELPQSLSEASKIGLYEDLSVNELNDRLAKQERLDEIRTEINQLDAEAVNLEHTTDTAPAPWSPHLDTWYEPALKAFLREAAERLEPDKDGDIRITWTPAEEQVERYNLRKFVDRIEWIRNEAEGEELPTWDVTAHFKADAAGNVRVKTVNALSEQRLHNWFGKSVAEKIVKDEYDFVNSDNEFNELADWVGINVGDLPIGGEWAVRLYGDKAETIADSWPEQPDLLEFAWKSSGNKAVIPAWFEKYGKAWGAKLEIGEKRWVTGEYIDDPANPDYGIYPETQQDQPIFVVPEAMRQSLLKEGQLFFGRTIPELPKQAREKAYGLRNKITTEEATEVARELLNRRFKRVTNPLTGERIPDPGREEGGFLGFGRKKKEELDPRVATDIDLRGAGNIAGPSVFFRSPSKWLLGFEDPRTDSIVDHIFDAEVREHDYTVEWGRRLSAIDSLILQASNIPERKLLVGLRERVSPIEGKKQAAYEKFIELVEKDFEVPDSKGKLVPNPDRQSKDPLVQRALEEHDKLTEDFRQYLIQSYRDRGIDMPNDWGITEKGYFRHLFPGEDNIFMDGDYMGTGVDYMDAIVKANKLIDANPTAKVEIKRRPVQFVDPSVRVSTRSYERLVQKLVGTVHDDGYHTVSAREIREDLVGTVGKRENIAKFLGATLKREGHEGYLLDYEQVMRAHLFQLARSQELSRLRKEITPTLEELRREGKYGVVEAIERHMDDLWGRPLQYEKLIGGYIRRFPRLREKVTNPDLGAELTARRIAGFHNLFKLKYNPKAILVNRVQPLRTLWPYLTNKDMWEVVKKYRDPKWRQTMTDLGVMMGAVKLETGGSRVEGFGAVEFLKDPFTYVSGSNRALGYTAGVVMGQRGGLTGYELHKEGMRWAAKTEFDNSKWDAPRFLRHSAGQIFGQYKGFFVKDIENTISIWSRQTGDKPGKAGLLSRASRIGKWALGTGVAGGARAALSPIPWLGTAIGYSLYLQGAALIQAVTGVSEKDAKFYASIGFLGPPAALGVDLSSSVTPIDEPPGFTAWEKVGRFAGGPTVSGAYDVGVGIRQVVKPAKGEIRSTGERLVNTAVKLSPYPRMAQRAYQLEQNLVHGKRQYVPIDKRRIPLSRTQLLFGSFGVPPSSQTLYYEEKEATGKSPFPPLPKKASPFESTFKNAFDGPFKYKGEP